MPSAIPLSDPVKVSQRTAGDIPVTVNFQQSISGYYTQRPDYFGARGANWSATLSGTRTGAGSVPGSFTGSGSGRAEAFPGYFANTLNNKPLSLTTQGQVTASGKAGQPLTGTMTSTFNTTGIESVSLKGPVTLNPNGSLKWQNFSGEVRHNGTQVGAMTGTVNQGPTK
ncbi:MAG: hypothetical protein M1353_04720 [Nitrospirae bacterium]|nr:hypothetical protein [Nitrospirota bacterium]